MSDERKIEGEISFFFFGGGGWRERENERERERERERDADRKKQREVEKERLYRDTLRQNDNSLKERPQTSVDKKGVAKVKIKFVICEMNDTGRERER